MGLKDRVDKEDRDCEEEDFLPGSDFAIRNNRGRQFQKMGRLPFQKKIHLIPPKSAIEKKEMDELSGKVMEAKFDFICQEIIQHKVLPRLVSAKHAPSNEDRKHQTDFKLRWKHPKGYEFFMKVQVKSSRSFLNKKGARPLAPDIVLIVINRMSDINNVAHHLDNAYKVMIESPQEAV